MANNEKRVSQRFKARAGSYVSYVEGSGAIRDVSMDGIFILDSDPLAAGTTVNFSVRMGNETLMFKGIVKRCVLQEGMGIQFQDVSRDLRRRLVSYVACISKEDLPVPDPKRAGLAGTATARRMPMPPAAILPMAGSASKSASASPAV